MESEETTENHIEYVELLDSDVFEENPGELIEIHDEASIATHTDGIMHEIVTIADDSSVAMLDNYEEIQYVEAEVEIAENSLINHENQTIFIHDGRKYVISNDQLTSGDQAIILDEQDGQLIQEPDETDANQAEMIESIDEHESASSPMYYASDMDLDIEPNGNASNQLIGRQFAVLKDGKLHLTNIADDADSPDIRQFESTLSNYETEDVADDDEDEDAADAEQLSEITGRNLITGQTISLSGILEKMRRKTSVNDIMTQKQQRGTAALNQIQTQTPQAPDYVLVPPVTRRVVVGRTQDGKRLVGRILQIQKKIQPNDVKINQSSQNTFSIAMPPAKRNVKPRKKEPQPKVSSPLKIRETDEQKQNHVMKLRYVSRTVLDENVARTLAGLMDLESINKRLKGRRLIVRHIQRRSRDGKIIAGSKKIAYYCGRLKRQPQSDSWSFVPEYPAKAFDENGIDLPHTDDATNTDNINLRLSDDGRLMNEPPRQENDHDADEMDETLTLYLTETQDEYGKKKTKVTLPQHVPGNGASSGVNNGQKNQRAEDYTCKYCGKKFLTVASLKRHATVHDHSLRPLQCMTCLGRFTDESSLKKHMMLHTGLRPHKCNLCDKSFAHRGDLNFHLRTHDPVKRYECHVCKKQFNRHSNMLRHAEIHRPFNSKTPETTTDSFIVNTMNDEYSDSNVETETDAATAAPFTCDQCGIQYNFSSSLTRHIVNVHLKQTDES